MRSSSCPATSSLPWGIPEGSPRHSIVMRYQIGFNQIMAYSRLYKRGWKSPRRINFRVDRAVGEAERQGGRGNEREENKVIRRRRDNFRRNC